MKLKFLFVFCFFSVSIFAQSIKKRLNVSEELFNSGRYYETLNLVETVLVEDSTNLKALKLKIKTLLHQNNKGAAIDLFNLNRVNIENENDLRFLFIYFYNIGDNVNIQKIYQREKTKNITIEQFDIIIESYLETNKIDSALKCSEECIHNFGENSIAFYYKGYIQEKSNNFSQALVNYQKAVYFLDKDDNNTFDKYKLNMGLARSFFAISSYENSLSWCEKSIQQHPDNFEANRLKSIILIKLNLLSEALLYLKKSNDINHSDKEVLKDLFTISKQLKLNQEALNWVLVLCDLDKENKIYSIEKVKLYLELKQFLKAYNELKVLQNYNPKDPQIYELIKESKSDTEAPSVKWISNIADTLYSGKITNDIEIAFEIHEKSPIKLVRIGSTLIEINKDSILRISRTIDISKIDTLKIEVIDAFDNNYTRTIKVVRDTIKPQIQFLFPSLIANSIVPDNSSDKEIYIELVASDNFPIIGIVINGINKNFRTNKQIRFYDKINIENKDTVIIEVTDIYSNKTIKKLYIDRKKSEENTKNPMGRTFVILISNYGYTNLRELAGPIKDAVQIKASFSKYSIDSIIQLENLNLLDFKRLFEKEIHQIVNNYNINSLVIWYSGHGKYSDFHNTGFWLPIEAVAEDFDNYYSLRELKISLSGIKRLKHLLVVSDACETGKSFYTQKIIRGNNENTCNDWTLTKMSSIECFTSSDGELSSDHSLFAQTFSSVLNNNPDPCISIGVIAEKVKEIVETYQTQKPVFGHITGMEDENGSFVFIKR